MERKYIKESTEARYVVQSKNENKRKLEALKGSIWLSGYDERLCDTIDKLDEGEYIIVFEPDNKAGSDGIKKIDIYKKIEGDW